MRLEIPDDIVNKEKYFRDEIIRKRLKQKRPKTHIARELGVSVRTLFDYMKKHPEFCSSIQPNQYGTGNSDWDRYRDDHRWKTKSVDDLPIEK